MRDSKWKKLPPISVPVINVHLDCPERWNVGVEVRQPELRFTEQESVRVRKRKRNSRDVDRGEVKVDFSWTLQTSMLHRFLIWTSLVTSFFFVGLDSYKNHSILIKYRRIIYALTSCHYIRWFKSPPPLPTVCVLESVCNSTPLWILHYTPLITLHMANNNAWHENDLQIFVWLLLHWLHIGLNNTSTGLRPTARPTAGIILITTESSLCQDMSIIHQPQKFNCAWQKLWYEFEI